MVKDISSKQIKDEWVIEQWTKDGARVIGKILLDPTIHLSNFDLETIWDLANFGSSQPQEVTLIGESPYKGMLAFISGEFIYVPLNKSLSPEPKYVSVCNCDIFIRKHYNTEIGYYIHTERQRDEWRYGQRDEWIYEMKKSIYNL